MAKDFDSTGDITPDTGSDVGNNTGSDRGGDLASDDGVDLNAGGGNLAKTSVKDRLIAAGLLPVAATGVYDRPNEHVQDLLNDPVHEYQQTVDRPPDKTPQEWAAEIGATIREGGLAEETHPDSLVVQESETGQGSPDYVGLSPEQVAEQTAQQQGFTTVSSESEQSVDTFSDENDKQETT